MGKQEWNSVSGERQGRSINKLKPLSIDQLARRRELWISLSLIFVFAGTFIAGSLLWTKELYTAENGLGYYLGLSGGVFMLLAYAYAFVKYIPFLRRGGFIMSSLRTHIVLAVVGSYLVLLHSTFQIGSMNSGVAYISMFLVFLSGVIGRYLYTRTHYGIGQSKATLIELETQLEMYKGNDALFELMEHIQKDYLKQRYSFIAAVIGLVKFPLIRLKIKSALRQSGLFSPLLVKTYVVNVKKIALFSVYERLFYAWRHAHVPLLWLLFLSGVIHVVAVHIY
ncbi:MAG: hypothetical protein OEX19_04755 [Gammaproteobacteria bacterium]|nr:hypothetical protein [Gammaproteobacteria bacterium]